MPVVVQVVSSRGLGWSKHGKATKVKARFGVSSTVGDPAEDAELIDSTGAVPGSGDPVAAAAPVAPARAVPVAIT